MSGGISPKAEAVMLGHKEAYEAMGEYEKAAEVERDLATLRRITAERGIPLYHVSEFAAPSAPPLYRTRSCIKCGAEFRPRGKQMYCSIHCREAALYARLKERRERAAARGE